MTTSGNIALRKMMVAQAIVAHQGKPAEECSELRSVSSQSVGQPTPEAMVATLTGAAAATVDEAASEATLAAISETLPAGAAAVMADIGATAALVADGGAAAAAGAELNQPKRRMLKP